MEAFRWKSPRMPLLHYGHEQRSEITERVHVVGSNWLNNLGSQNSQSGTSQQPEAGGANLGHEPQAEKKKKRKSES